MLEADAPDHVSRLKFDTRAEASFHTATVWELCTHTTRSVWLFLALLCSDVFDDGLREPPKVEREDERDVPRKGQLVRTQAEAYMLFKEGIRPVTEFEAAPGVRATKGRRRAELAVREFTTPFTRRWRAVGCSGGVCVAGLEQLRAAKSTAGSTAASRGGYGHGYARVHHAFDDYAWPVGAHVWDSLTSLLRINVYAAVGRGRQTIRESRW